MCHSSGRPPTSTIGLGRYSVSSRMRVPMPPHSRTTLGTPVELISLSIDHGRMFLKGGVDDRSRPFAAGSSHAPRAPMAEPWQLTAEQILDARRPSTRPNATRPRPSIPPALRSPSRAACSAPKRSSSSCARASTSGSPPARRRRSSSARSRARRPAPRADGQLGLVGEPRRRSPPSPRRSSATGASCPATRSSPSPPASRRRSTRSSRTGSSRSSSTSSCRPTTSTPRSSRPPSPRARAPS